MSTAEERAEQARRNAAEAARQAQEAERKAIEAQEELLRQRRERERVPGRVLDSWRDIIRRKADSIVFVDAQSVRRVLELEYQLEDSLASEMRALGIGHYPVAMLPRETAGAICARAVDESRLPTLTQAESVERAGRILVARADEILGDQIPESLRRDLSELPRGRQRADRDAALRRLFEVNVADYAEAWAQLLADPWFSQRITQLLHNQLVFVADPDPQPKRTLITLEYETSVGRAGAAAATPRVRIRTLSQLLGWRDTALAISVGDVGAAETTELRFEAPDGVELAEATAQVYGPEAPVRHGADVDVRNPRRFATVVLSDVEPGTPALLYVRMRPERGYLAAVALSAVFSAILITLGWLRLRWLDVEADVTTTLLLAGPTIFAALIAQPGRGTPAARMLVAARGALILAGFWSFMAAATLAAYPYAHVLESIWTGLGVAAWATAAILFVALVSPLLPAARRSTAV